MIYETAYETTVCKGYDLSKLKKEIEFYLNDIKETSLKDNNFIYTILPSSFSSMISPFNHPYKVEEKKAAIDYTLVVDMRPCFSIDKNDNLTITNRAMYELNTLRAQLNRIWLLSGPNYLFNVSDECIAAYSRWISDSIVIRYGLNPHDLCTIEALAAIFYISLFKDTRDWDDDLKSDILNKLTKPLKIPGQYLESILNNLDKPMVNVHDLVENIKIYTESVRLKELSHGVLFTIISRSWFGFNSPELLAVALEHPPTWLALVYTSLNNRLYAKTGLTKVTERIFRRDGERFKREIKNFIEIMND
jgi:hypothetical protein